MIGGKKAVLILIICILFSNLVFAVNVTNTTKLFKEIAELEVKIPDFVEITEFDVPSVVYEGQTVTLNVAGYFNYHTLEFDWDCDDFQMDLVIAEDDPIIGIYNPLDDEYIDERKTLPGSECVWMGYESGNFIQYRFPFSYSYDIDFSSQAGAGNLEVRPPALPSEDEPSRRRSRRGRPAAGERETP